MKDHGSGFWAAEGLEHALELLRNPPGTYHSLPDVLPEGGIGEIQALDMLAPLVFGSAARLNASQALAHMDPPTPWITWATALWNASLNQNLLHEATSPFATKAERRLIDWLRPYFGMQGGHFCSGSSIANLTALWAARDAKNITRVVASELAHISVEKAARILGLRFEKVRVDEHQRLDPSALGNLDDACLVLTAGTTASGAIDPLWLAGSAKWTHVDAAWAGPLRLSSKYAHLLKNIELADSVAVSAHKWFFQPKESAIIFFKNIELSNAAISFGGSYLANPNIGVQGSRGAAAISLLATLLAWGREGIAEHIEHTMLIAEKFSAMLGRDNNVILRVKPETAINVFRPKNLSVESFMSRIPDGMLSSCVVDDEPWVRSVAANPMADADQIYEAVVKACQAIA
jgi:glutamate/tyrosine decarboxylase-like PLP-dependent enzyme